MNARRLTLPKSAADYATIAVAPLLIFVMISSLVNFLMLIFYRGNFPERLSWTMLMFTLGAVSIARIAIERDRAYSLGYGGVLGLVTYLAMLRFVDSPAFSFVILVVIAYLADVIVRDCTLIEDDVDASGQGLVDSGRLFVKQKIESSSATPEESAETDDPPKSSRKTHQPGRTIMYLALAALPLFGLGQFMLRNSPDIWARARWLLAFYLFASLSLLVTTSFLGLRRYLRQRNVEMPSDVSVGWLTGGLGVIALVLMLAYIAPIPGRAIATFEPPSWLDSPGDTVASRFGWGDEGADNSGEEDRASANQESSEQQPQGERSEQGAPPGDVGDGNRQDGPGGKQGGGKQDGGKQDGGEQGSSESQSSKQNQSDSSGNQGSQNQQNQSQSNKRGDQQQSSSESSASNESQNPDQSQSSSPQNSDQSAGDSSENNQQTNSSDQNQSSEQSSSSESSEQGESSDPQSDADSDPNQESPSESNDPNDSERADQNQESQDAGDSQSSNSQSSSGSTSSQSSPSSSASNIDVVGAISGFFKFIVFVVLAGIVAAFLWMHRELIAAWWEKLFGGGAEETNEMEPAIEELVAATPPRPFASFRNPVGSESDLRKVVVITFQAFEAWTREQGTTRKKDETPAEFMRRLSKAEIQVSPAASQVVDAYNRIVYGRGRATEQDVQAAESVWKAMK